MDTTSDSKPDNGPSNLADHSEDSLRPWITAISYMNPGYREIVVHLALSHRDQASPELRKASRTLDSISLPGFRSFRKV